MGLPLQMSWTYEKNYRLPKEFRSLNSNFQQTNKRYSYKRVKIPGFFQYVFQNSNFSSLIVTAEFSK